MKNFFANLCYSLILTTLLISPSSGESADPGQAIYGSSERQLQEIQQQLKMQDAEIRRLRSELDAAVGASDSHLLPPLPGYAVSQSSPQSSNVEVSNLDATLQSLSNGNFTKIGSGTDTGLNLNTYSPLFDKGIVIQSDNVAMKIGGYVKVDVIQDFQPVGNEAEFDTQTILIGVPQRQNSNLHAQQSRLNFDTRWDTDLGQVRAFVEGDFFGDNNTYRLRHAYGEVRQLIVGQTWSTFANVRAVPPTLDSAGPASIINQRQSQVRWTQEILHEGLSFSVAVENPDLTVTNTISDLSVTSVTDSPDLVTRLLYADEQTSLQLSGVVRSLGLITPNGDRFEQSAWGANASATHHFSENDEGYLQFVVGDGIGSYNGIPDVVSDGISRGGLLPMMGWMVAWNHRWTKKLQSSLTYSENILDNPSYQPGDELHRNTYFSTNLIWSPATHYFMGIEYLYGIRENVDGQDAEAHRLQTSFGFYLP